MSAADAQRSRDSLAGASTTPYWLDDPARPHPRRPLGAAPPDAPTDAPTATGATVATGATEDPDVTGPTGRPSHRYR
ncbi:MAG: hypothetical protein ACR2FP_02260 [Nocardioidaceae bacterium]